MMLRALYAFKKTHPTSISFAQGDLFVELPGAASDKNWNYVMAVANGATGFVPRNYMASQNISAEMFGKHINSLRDRVRMLKLQDKEKAELISKLEAARNSFIEVLDDVVPVLVHANNDSGHVQIDSERSGSPQRAITKKRAAPQPPSVKSTPSDPNAIVSVTENCVDRADRIDRVDRIDRGATYGNSVDRHDPPSAASATATTSATSARRPSLADPSSEQVRAHARELVQLLRIETGLSYSISQSVAHTVLQYICTNFQRLDRNVPALLESLESGPMLVAKEDVSKCADTRLMESLFEKLTQAKEDDQQRNWMLHEDEAIIADLLKRLANSLEHSSPAVSKYVMQKFKYFYINNLVEYFQMETRWSLRRRLIEVFMLMCSLDSDNIVPLLLSSVLPLELAQDLFQHSTSVGRLRYCGLLLTTIFSQGLPMPVHYFNQLGKNFVNFLLDLIEEPPSTDTDHEIPDIFIGLALSYNLQFKDNTSNVTLNCLSNCSSAKSWTEKILLLLNREDDPVAIVTAGHDRRATINSVQKIVLDMFSHDRCYELFYTGDLKCLIDIIVRQLEDLSPEDPRRHIYVKMCWLVLRKSDYSESLHRYRDLERCFVRILGEDECPNDKRLVETICREVAEFSTLL